MVCLMDIEIKVLLTGAREMPKSNVVDKRPHHQVVAIVAIVQKPPNGEEDPTEHAHCATPVDYTMLS
jgi:hypothetical protein